MHRHVQNDHTQRSVRAEFWIFALKVRYSRSKVKPLTHHLTPLMTVLGHHIHLVGRPRQGQHTIPVSRSPGQGHSGGWRFWPIFRIFANSSLNFDRIELGVHRYKEDDHMQLSVRAEFWIFTPKVRYSRSKVKPLMNHLTPLMAVLGHHVYLVGRPRQGQHAIAVSRSPGEGQGHRGQKKFSRSKIFFSIFYAF